MVLFCQFFVLVSQYSTQIVHKIAGFTQLQSTWQNLRVPKSCTFEQLNVQEQLVGCLSQNPAWILQFLFKMCRHLCTRQDLLLRQLSFISWWTCCPSVSAVHSVRHRSSQWWFVGFPSKAMQRDVPFDSIQQTYLFLRSIDFHKWAEWVSGETTFWNLRVPTKVGVLGIKSIPNALQYLKNAPPLVTVEYCLCPNTRPSSQFPGVWGNCQCNHAVVACNGAILKGNATASVDDFLAAAIRCHELMLAAELVSLVAIHGGVAHTRSVLLKSHTIKAQNVQLTSFLDESLGDRCYDKRSGAICKTDARIHTNLINRKHHQNSSGVSTSMGTSEILLQSSSERCHASAINALALFVLKVLCAIPIEIRVFAAEMFLDALSTVVSGPASMMLGACQSRRAHYTLNHLLWYWI